MADLKPQLSDFNWPDPFLLDSQLSEDDRMLRDAAAQFAQNELQPLIIDAYREATVNPGLFPKMGEAGLLGATIPEGIRRPWRLIHSLWFDCTGS